MRSSPLCSGVAHWITIVASMTTARIQVPAVAIRDRRRDPARRISTRLGAEVTAATVTVAIVVTARPASHPFRVSACASDNTVARVPIAQMSPVSRPRTGRPREDPRPGTRPIHSRSGWRARRRGGWKRSPFRISAPRPGGTAEGDRSRGWLRRRASMPCPVEGARCTRP